MLHRRRNLSFVGPPCEDGDRFEGCNPTQAQPRTPICQGCSGLTFVSCNLTNWPVPADARVEDCQVP